MLAKTNTWKFVDGSMQLDYPEWYYLMIFDPIMGEWEWVDAI